jgi:hypothetical protein
MKKKLGCLILMMLGFSLTSSALSQAAATNEGAMTGAGRATFAPGAAFAGVALSGVNFGAGVFVESDGSASGTFGALLAGRSILGQPRQITVDGNVLQGSLADGQASISGIATINLGDGTPALPGVPFTLTTTAEGLRLTLGATALPVAQLSSGAVVVQ